MPGNERSGRLLPLAEQEIGKQLLLETAAYAESSVCRRKTLLHYFGEEYTEENCGNQMGDVDSCVQLGELWKEELANTMDSVGKAHEAPL